jgi:hypothetical protein
MGGILDMDVRLAAGTTCDVVGDEHMALHDKNLLGADPAYEGGVGKKCDAMGGIVIATDVALYLDGLYLDRRQIE